MIFMRWDARRLLVLLLGLVVLAGAVGCFYNQAIIGACGSSPEPGMWVGRPPLSLCMSGGASTNGTNFLWDFGDGTTGTGKDVNHTYTEIGEYTVTLTVTFPEGRTDSTHEYVSVAGEPIARFTSELYEPSGFMTFLGLAEENTDGLEILFDAGTSTPSPDVHILWVARFLDWDFGDGTQERKEVGGAFWSLSNDFTIRHRYAAAGTYTVMLTLTDNLGYTSTISQEITVGTPGAGDDLTENFDLTSIFWAPGDPEEGEGDCLSIYGTVKNNGTVPAGVQLMAVAYDAAGAQVGSFSYWPAGSTNIGAGVDYAFGFFLCELSIPPAQVADVIVSIHGAAIR